jgi:Ca2+-binding RTX toxin-like protein
MYGGIHFRFDNEDGLACGTDIGNYVANHLFQPADRGLDAALVDGTLVIQGSEGHDLVRLAKSRNQIVVYADGRQLASFALADVQSIAIDVHGGNDLVLIDDGIRIAATIFGGAGHDVLYGGGANDRIDGGDGRDLIFGVAGNDDLLGGAGDDILFGLAGNDLLDGGDGDDLLFGGAGLDTLIGGSGRNRMFQ